MPKPKGPPIFLPGSVTLLRPREEADARHFQTRRWPDDYTVTEQAQLLATIQRYVQTGEARPRLTPQAPRPVEP